jgi:hypothetical protein
MATRGDGETLAVEIHSEQVHHLPRRFEML